MIARRTAATLVALAASALCAPPSSAASPPTLDTCALASRAAVAAALGTAVSDGRRLSGNGACQYRAPGGRSARSATIAERAGDDVYFRAYVRNARAELNVDPTPVAGLGEAAVRWPGNVAFVQHGRFALVTILGVTGPKAERAALAIARAVAKQL